jgi:hypothetical protein
MDELEKAIAELTLAVTRRFDAVDRALRDIDERMTLMEDKIDRLLGATSLPTGC